MSNPTGDALHAAGLEDAAGVIKPVAAEVTDKPSALNATLEKMRRIGSWDVSFVQILSWQGGLIAGLTEGTVCNS